MQSVEVVRVSCWLIAIAVNPRGETAHLCYLILSPIRLGKGSPTF